MTPTRLVLASPRGYCAGVDRAVDTVERALDHFGAPVYVRKEIVHNWHVVQELADRGAVFVDSELDVPEGAVVVLSAHGVAPEVYENSRSRGLQVLDATCPLVTKVHVEAKRFAADGYTIVLIGHEGHEEVVGTMGEAPDAIRLIGTVEEIAELDIPDPERVAFITQTTLSVDETVEIIAALRERFPAIVGPKKDDICYATQNRQNAVKELAAEVDLVLVIGSRNSSNSNRLVDVTREMGVASYLIDDESSIEPAWLEGVDTVGITSGASAPESLVERVVDYFRELRRHAGRIARAGQRERPLLLAARAAPRRRLTAAGEIAQASSASSVASRSRDIRKPARPGASRLARCQARVSAIVSSIGRCLSPAAIAGPGSTQSIHSSSGSPPSHNGRSLHGSTSRSSRAWLSAQTMSAPAPETALQRSSRAPIVSGAAGPTALKRPLAPRSAIATIQPARSRTSITCVRAPGSPGRQHRAALRDPRRPVGEAVGGIVGPHDQARPHDQRTVAELVLGSLLAERLQRAVAGLGDLLDRARPRSCRPARRRRCRRRRSGRTRRRWRRTCSGRRSGASSRAESATTRGK